MHETSDTLTGPIGTAERLDPNLNNKSTTLETWFLHLPPAHPIWPRYLLSVIHLRPDPAFGPARLKYPGATHELMVVALDPEKNPQPNQPETWHHLTPINYVNQFHGLTDAGAAGLARTAAEQVVQGQLWVETSDIAGGKAQWDRFLRDAVRAAQVRGVQ